MAKKDIKDLQKFLKPFPAETKATALWLRDFVWELYPSCNELIYDNYNALAFGWSLTDKLGQVFCNIAVGRTTHNVHFGFFWGSKINDPKKLLIGQGNQYRYLLVKNKKDFPGTYIKKLLREAYNYSWTKMKTPEQIVKGATITKSISAKKRTR